MNMIVAQVDFLTINLVNSIVPLPSNTFYDDNADTKYLFACLLIACFLYALFVCFLSSLCKSLRINYVVDKSLFCNTIYLQVGYFLIY